MAVENRSAQQASDCAGAGPPQHPLAGSTARALGIGAFVFRDSRKSLLSLEPDRTQIALEAKLRAGFIREPSVAVEIEAYRPFFILGEVAAPGQYPYVPNMTVESAVAIAGGFSPRARRDQPGEARDPGRRLRERRVGGERFRRSSQVTSPWSVACAACSSPARSSSSAAT